MAADIVLTANEVQLIGGVKVDTDLTASYLMAKDFLLAGQYLIGGTYNVFRGPMIISPPGGQIEMPALDTPQYQESLVDEVDILVELQTLREAVWQLNMQMSAMQAKMVAMGAYLDAVIGPVATGFIDPNGFPPQPPAGSGFPSFP